MECIFVVQQYHLQTIVNVREAAKIVGNELGIPNYPVSIALDTKGPEIRTGLLEGVKQNILVYVHNFYNYKLINFGFRVQLQK